MSGFYGRLRQLCQSGQWEEALRLMRVSDLPTMKDAFRTTRSGEERYEMVFSFKSMEAMHQADDEWHEFRRATKRGEA